MDGVGGKGGWSWIVSRATSYLHGPRTHTQFIWEGLLTLFCGVASFWMVHDWPQQAKFLTPLERHVVLARLKADQGLAQEGTLNWRITKQILSDWKVACLMLMYIGAAEPLYSGSLFLPTIIAALGKWSRSQSVLLSVPRE